ncbi:MAG: hypothetical protein QOH21_3037 [Acidobacteriota bacterium]|nr:hypothetical protein [Acidobacteriota bacterium]
MFYTAAGSLKQLRKQVTSIRTFAQLPEPQLYASSPVSAWTPSEHLDHLIRVCTSIVELLLDPAARPLSRKINVIGRVILHAGRIPRGRAAAPKQFIAERTATAQLLASLDALEMAIARIPIADIPKRTDATVKHPRFGGLTPSQALRFVAIHNDHHLRIIADMLKGDDR